MVIPLSARSACTTELIIKGNHVLDRLGRGIVLYACGSPRSGRRNE